jgi:putative sterol carrier protein
MAFAKAEDLYKVFKLTLDKVKKDEKLYASLAASDMVVGIKIPNIDAFITLELKGSIKDSYGPPTVKVDVTSVNDDVIFNQFWQGKVNLMMAMTKGQVKAQGAVTKMLKLLPKISPIYKMYTESLKEAGREDLVIIK